MVGVRGLILRVNYTGTRTWLWLFKSPVTGTWRKVSLGNYPTISLQQAKDAALDCMAGVRIGRDPLAPDDGSDMTMVRLAREYQAANERRHSVSWKRSVQDSL